jgi:hypothetical protein
LLVSQVEMKYKNYFFNWKEGNSQLKNSLNAHHPGSLPEQLEVV